MIKQDKSRFYVVYPSWAKHAWRWEELDAAFRDPFVTGKLGLDKRDYFESLGYQIGPETYELLPGPVGNGIIRGFCGKQESWIPKLYWRAVLIHGKDRDGADFSTLPDFGPHSEYDVRWLEAKRTGEHRLGLKDPFPTYLPSITLDYAECSDDVVFVSLAFRALPSGNVDDEVCLRFQMRCQVFGLKCLPVDVSGEVLPDAIQAMVSPKVTHCWYAVQRNQNDLGLFVAKMFYLACAAKQEADKRFQFIHLVGAFDGKPTMSRVLRYRTGLRVYGTPD